MLQESILQYFLPSLSYHLSLRPLFCLFLSDRLRQVLLYCFNEVHTVTALRWIEQKYHIQGLKIVLVRSYLRVPQAAGQVNILIFLVKIKFSPCMPINFVMQGKCLFSDISRPDIVLKKSYGSKSNVIHK